MAGCSCNTVRGLLVVACAFICFVTSTGLAFTLGYFYMSFLDVFQLTNAKASLIGSINFGVLCVVGSFSSLITRKISISNCVILGGWLTAVGVFGTSLSTTIYMVYIFLGVVAGTGCGLTYTACLFKVSLTFTRWRALASGVALAGIGVGHFAYPFIISSLLDRFGWRGSFWIIGAAQLHVVLCGVVLKSSLCRFVECTQTGRSSLRNSRLERSSKLTQHETVEVESTTHVPQCQETLLESEPGVSSVKHIANVTGQNYCQDQQISQTASLHDGDTNEPESVNSRVNDVKRPDTSAKPEFDSMDWPAYICVYSSTTLYYFGQSIVLTHVVAFSITTLRYSSPQSALLLAVIGISSTLGRIVLGAIQQLPFLDVFMIYILCTVSLAVSVLGFRFGSDYTISLALMVVFGFNMAVAGPVLNEVVIAVAGIKKYTFGYAMIMSASAFGSFLGAPTAGWLYDVTLRYENSFYLASAVLFCDALIVALAWLWRKYIRPI